MPNKLRSTVSAGARKKKILIADMDSTMIQQECVDELADEAGVGPYVASITARAMNGEIGFEGALRERVERDLAARRERAAEELALGGDDVEVRRGAEVDDDAGAAVEVVRREGVGDAVGADLARAKLEDAKLAQIDAERANFTRIYHASIKTFSSKSKTKHIV